MGESEEDCLFAEQCSVWQRELGLPFVKTEVVWVKPSIEWWRHVPGPTDVKGDWSATLMKMLGARIKREKNQLGYMPCLIAECFDGIRVTKATESYDKARFETTLLKNLLFAKHLGIKDVGPFNMLVGPNHDVLLVDIGKPSIEQLNEYNKKGLFTTQKFTRVQLRASLLHCRRADIKSFVQALKRLPCASLADRDFWMSVDTVLTADDEDINISNWYGSLKVV